MRLLLAVVVLLSLCVSVDKSFAGCTEYKVIEHENSTEVVCVGGESLTEVGPTRQERETESSQQNIQQLLAQEQKAKEICNQEYTICSNGCSSGDVRCVQGCGASKAQCLLSAIYQSPETLSKCKSRCSLEYDYCSSNCSSVDVTCVKGCSASKASCEMQCL